MDKLYLAEVDAWNRRGGEDGVSFIRLVYAVDMDAAYKKARDWFEDEHGNWGINGIDVSEPL